MRARWWIVAVAALAVATTGFTLLVRSSGHRVTDPSVPHAVPSAAPGTPSVPVGAAERVVQILQEMHTASFNAQAPPEKGSAGSSGGLYINWNPSWNGDPSTAGYNTDYNSNGETDVELGRPARHDEFTDLVYLRNLLGYRAAHPTDHSFDADIARMEPIVKADFQAYTYYKCSLYWELQDMARFDPSGAWRTMAAAYARVLYSDHYDSSLGTVVANAGGMYRVDYAAACAAALTDAGQRARDRAMLNAGLSTAHHVMANAIDPTTHLLPLQMAASTSGQDATVDRQVKVGEEAQTLDALLTMYDLTHDASFLAEVQAAVSWMYSSPLHDQGSGGFYFGVDSDGTNLQSSYKESRQAWMLALLSHLNTIQPGRWTAQLDEALMVVKDKLWQSTVGGYVYRVTPHFELYETHAGPGHNLITENWVTSEAMDIACQTMEGVSG